jgi:hypothetical protein
LTEESSIGGQRPTDIRIENWDDEIVGKMMHYVCENSLPDAPDKAQILEDLKTGRYSFLFNRDRKFAADHMDLVSPDRDDNS